MKAHLQRVSRASVAVDDQTIASIEKGLLVLLAIEHGDSEVQADWLAKKTSSLRIFPSDDKEMDLSVSDIGGSVLVISQFTLAADIRKGNRPNFSNAAEPELAAPLVARFVTTLQNYVTDVCEGEFGANMQVSLTNDGPVTMLLERQ
ncbi:MAG: D-tyrosyl-tRNA(Tyr) deacylase [Gammaproteobacteria bacterium]|nr:D-tyrosyl-tRNA(Tyr) deacylase [Gammaproteobacteria bacterium]